MFKKSICHRTNKLAQTPQVWYKCYEASSCMRMAFLRQTTKEEGATWWRPPPHGSFQDTQAIIDGNNKTAAAQSRPAHSARPHLIVTINNQPMMPRVSNQSFLRRRARAAIYDMLDASSIACTIHICI